MSRRYAAHPPPPTRPRPIERPRCRRSGAAQQRPSRATRRRGPASARWWHASVRAVGRGSVPRPAGPPNEEGAMPTLSEAERSERREADREKAREAVEALKTSAGWKRWLA